MKVNSVLISNLNLPHRHFLNVLFYFAARVKSFDKALEQFEKAGNYAVKCGNKGNVALLHEAEHCLKIYLDKQTPEPEAKSQRSSRDGERDSDEDIPEKDDTP